MERLLAKWPLWLLPLTLCVFPAWMARMWTCEVPHADHWPVVVVPLFQWLDGTSLWTVIHQQVNDSRHDIPKLLHLLLARATQWNLRFESLCCVAIATATAGVTLWGIRRNHVCGPVSAWLLAIVSVALLLSPQQWMNWTFGVQLCYMLVVFFTVATVAVLRSGLPLSWRAFIAGVCAACASHCFLNGWFAWPLGFVCLARELRRDAASRGAAVRALIVFSAMLVLTACIFFPGFKFGASTEHMGDPMLDRAATNPAAVAKFFVSVLGAPFGDGWPARDRETRFDLSSNVAPCVGIVSLALLAFALVSILRHRAAWDLRRGLPSFLFIIWGLANAAAIAVGRTGVMASGPFESRYLAFTLWFHIGLLSLLFRARGPLLAKLRIVWLAFVIYGYGIGFVQGVRDAARDYHRNEKMVTACAFRHVAVEPELLDSVWPGVGPVLIEMLDRLDSLGCLHVPLVKDVNLSGADLKKEEAGLLERGSAVDAGVSLSGWAIDPVGKDLADAVVISMQPEGQPEKWLGIAQKRHPRLGVAGRHAPRALEGRIGWEYRSTTGQEKSMFSDKAVAFKPSKVPAGKVTLRAYVFDNGSGAVFPLSGSVELTIP